MVRFPNKRLALVAFSTLLTLVLLLASAARAPAIAVSTALLWLNPASAATDRGATTNVVVQLDNITDVFGIQLSLSFDPTVLQVVDADAGTSGVQINPGSCPRTDFVVSNTADNGAGTIQYAVTQLALPPCDGGTVATIQFQCIAGGTSSEVNFSDSLISDGSPTPISHTTQSSTVTCNHAIYLPLVLKN